MESCRPFFCTDCRSLLEILDPKERCRSCFQILQDEGASCLSCKKNCHFIHFAAVYSYDSPAGALIKHLKYGGQEEYSSLIAAWMVVQLENLNYPWPDALVPVPQSFPRRLVRGYNPTAQLAYAMSQLMNVPVVQALSRNWASLPQACKNAEERSRMSEKEFLLRSSVTLDGKNILLIDDVITTGTTLKRCAEALLPTFPASIRGLSFCLA